MMNPPRFTIALAAAGVIAWHAHAMTQPRRPGAKQEPFYTLTLQEGIAPAGKAGALSGRAGQEGHRIVTGNLSVVQPVTVLAIAADTAEPVRVDLVKGRWDEALRSGTTDASGRLVLKTRTEGNLGILVRSASGNPASYVVAVWAGDEMPSEPAPIFTAARGARDASGGSGGALVSGVLPWFGGSLLVLALAGAFVMRRRAQAQRRSGHDAV